LNQSQAAATNIAGVG